MLPKIKEAEQLMVKALTLLDEVGEFQAAPHLDMALYELREALSAAPTNLASSSTETH